MNHIKNIFIRNAALADEILIDRRVVKQKNKPAPTESIEFNKLRITFTDFSDADIERLDSAFIDINFQKKQTAQEGDFLILSRGTKVHFELR